MNLPALFNRPPPHSLESEMALLGAMLLAPNAIPSAQSIVQAGDFYHPAHAAIFASITFVFRESGELNIPALGNDLKTTHALDDVGGHSYLVKLAEETPGPAGTELWAKTVRGHAITRRLISEAASVIHDAYGARTLEESQELAARALERLSKASKDIDLGHAQTVGDAARGLLGDLEGKRRHLSPSGFDWFDRIAGGVPLKGVMTMIGHPSHGKTTAGLALMAQLTDLHGGGGTIHSVEQGPARVAGTLLSILTGLPVHQWMNSGHCPGEMERHALQASVARLDAMHLVVEPDSMDAAEIYQRAVHGATRGVRRVMVDYIQDLKPPPGFDSGAESMAESMRMLARIATELDMLVIVVSQVDKAARTADRAPRLNDSRGSAAIADRTDLGVSVYRPHFNERPVDNFDVMGCEAKRAMTEFTVVKNKYGPLGTATVRFDGKSMRFTGET